MGAIARKRQESLIGATMRGLLPHALKGMAGGAGAGLALFAAEAALILRASAVGLKMDVSGPLAALLAVVKPLLPGLVGRVAVAYLAAGAFAGLAAWLLASAWSPRPGWRRAGLFLAELAGIFILLAWHRVVTRPALADDILPDRLLAAVVNHGEPWHPAAAAAALLAAHAVAAGRRWARASFAALAALLAVAATRPAAAPHPLVVLIGVDAFRPDRLSALGGTGQVAPNLEAFARDATLFTRAYTPIAQTQPAWRGLLTARWPHHTGVRYPLTPASHWRTELPTFPRAMTEGGYQTAFWTDCSRFNYQGPASGFAESHQPPRGALNFLLEKLRFRALGMFADNRLGARWLPEFIDNRALAGIHNPLGYAHRLASHWVALAEHGPALVAYHATAAHFPGDPVYPFYRKFVSADEPLERRLRMSFAPIAQGKGEPSGGSRGASEGLYDELLSQADAQVGILLDALKERGLYDSATVVVFSDHGESFHADTPSLEGATPVHGSRLTDEENRILLMVKPPRGAVAQRIPQSDALVRLIDIGPTLLDLSGLAPLPGADGVSLAPLLRGESMERLRLYAETGFTHAAPDAFDPEHLAEAPRTFAAYTVRPDGAIEMTEDAHQAILREKDIGAFDGQSWVIRSPHKDGTVVESCRGDCANGSLSRWLDSVRDGT
jgi:arylsulfatase A-like enzyme